jgi:hypothetical protein
VGTDSKSLVEFFRNRSLTAEGRKELEKLIRQLGSDQYAQREQATKELIRRGRLAIPFLKRALENPDLEIVRRARRCLAAIKGGPGPELAMAAARIMARKHPAEAVPALLAYLPFADDRSVVEEVFAALLLASPKERKPDKALVAALDDPLPLLREAAVHVLAWRTDKTLRTAVRRRLADTNVKVRFQAARALLEAKDKTAVATLIALLGEEGDVAWQAEELLTSLAGDKGPSGSALGVDAEARRKYALAWKTWWKDNEAKVDLAKLPTGRRLLGLTMGIEYNTGRVWECDQTGKIRWEISGLSGPMEAQVLPGGRVLIVESNNSTLSERDFTGKVLWSKMLPISPTGCQRLPNGNTFVSSYNSVMEMDRDGKEVYRFNLPQGSNAIRKHRNGNILFTTDAELVEIDTKGKKVRSVPLPPGGYIGIRGLPGDRFLVASSGSGRVVEVDRTGKIHWEVKLSGACGVCRLPNGHTLVSTNQLVVEYNRAGIKVWEKRRDGYVRRVHRR